MTSFPDNFSYSFHRMRLKLNGQLDYEVVQRILFRGYSIPNFDSHYSLNIVQIELYYQQTPPTVCIILVLNLVDS